MDQEGISPWRPTGRSLSENHLGGLLVTLLAEEAVDGLAMLGDRPVQIAPRDLDLDRGVVQAPTYPPRPFTPRKHFVQPRAIGDHPSRNRSLIELHPSFSHECFAMAWTQRIVDLATPPLSMTSFGEGAP